MRTGKRVETSSVTAERLERLRTKLLDLSTMNRMLSFRHPRASCLRVVDELPGLLFDSLVRGDQLTFAPVDEPSRRDLEAWHTRRDQVPRAGQTGELKRPDAASWARQGGLNTDHDLPVETDSFLRSDRHSDKKIQTLHYPDELDTRLRKIKAAARTAIEESGANMLYVAFGFLEWRDQSGSKAHQAPLLMLPVELEREQTRGGRYRTKVRWTNEEIQQNLSLRKKLEEFNIKLPEFQEDQKLEAYLTEIIRAVRHRPDWLVRRYVTLGLFEFGKILLYLDLDPERWPSHAPIDRHPLVRAVLEGGDQDGEDGADSLSGGREIDPSLDVAKSRDLQLELIDRADSSQCEALEAALAGRNLVVEGPPGTGKSQTITNLVAAALARGKTVLFVAEKLAALEVVRRRMRELGLGDFCLELHSHKTRKAEVLEDIADRMRASGHARPPRDLEAALARLAERRKKLSDYIDIVSRPAGAFRDLSIGEALMRAGRARRKLGARVKEVEAAGLNVPTAAQLGWGQLADAKTRLRQFASAFEDLQVEGSAYEHPWAGISAARVLVHDSDRIGALASGWADAAEELETRFQQASLPELSAADLATAMERFTSLDQLRQTARQAEELVVWMEQALGVSIARTAKGATQAAALIGLAAAAPLPSLGLRSSFVLGNGSVAWLHRHRDRVRDIEGRRAALREIFKEQAFSRSADDLEEWSTAIGQRGLFARFGRRWRTAARVWVECARPVYLKIKPKQKAEEFARLRQLVLDERVLHLDGEIAPRLGPEARDPTFDLNGAIAVAEWADRIRSALPDSLANTLIHCPPTRIDDIGRAEGAAQSAALTKLASVNAEVGRSSFWASLAALFAPTALANRVIESAGDEAWARLLASLRACAQLAESVLASERAFASATDLDEYVWFGGLERPSLSGIASRARVAASKSALLPQWLDFDRFRRSSEREAERELVEAATAGRISTSKLTVSLDFVVFDSLARRAFSEWPALHSASGKLLDTLRDEYRSLDAQVMELRRAAIANKVLQRHPPEGRQSGLKSEITEMTLLRAEIAKQRRHIPIRQLVARAGRALQALKPCFMMGPLSVAQYIAPGSLGFDLIIMDEASQMRPEDAVGALARGGQAVIVGDPKQLPPTSFFDRIAEGTDEGSDDGDVTLAEDAKSILQLSSSIFDHRMLRWHYRSRHEALIAFSNRQFYKDELIVFPSPTGQAERFGIGWTSFPMGSQRPA